MANMSANILRNIVSSVLKIRSKNIKLSGEISLDMECPNWKGNSHDQRYESTEVWGFTPEKGLIELPTSYSDGYYYDNHPTFGNNAEYYKEYYEECIFFVIISDSCNQMQRPEEWDYHHSVSLFKAPNFQQYFASIEEAEIARWEQWLNE